MSQCRKVLHLIDTGGPGGAETIFLNVATQLERSRWESIPVVPVHDWLWGALSQAGMQPVQLSTRQSFDYSFVLRVAQLARRQHIDLIHTHLFSSAVYGTLAAMPLGLPVVSTMHGQTDVAPDESYRALKFRILRRRRNRTVFVSRRLESWFHEFGSLDPSRSRVVHNGIDCTLFQPARNDAVRKQLGAGPDDILVGAVGNLRRPKDYPTFLKAAAELSRRSPRYRFVIVGASDPDIQIELEQLRTELGITSVCQLTGFREDVHAVMNALDAYVLSSTSEGFSLTTVQAMASGVPVVATRCGGPEEIVSDGETGLLIPTRDPKALADAIELVTTQPQLRASLTGKARDCAVRDFSIEAMIGGYSQIYEECLQTSHERN